MSKPIALLAILLALATQTGALMSDAGGGESIITRQHVDNIAEFVTTTLVEVEQTTSPVDPEFVLKSAGSNNQLVGQPECRRGNWANDGSKCRESCACMASQFLYGLTGSIPFRKNSKRYVARRKSVSVNALIGTRRVSFSDSHAAVRRMSSTLVRMSLHCGGNGHVVGSGTGVHMIQILMTMTGLLSQPQR